MKLPRPGRGCWLWKVLVTPGVMLRCRAAQLRGGWRMNALQVLPGGGAHAQVAHCGYYPHPYAMHTHRPHPLLHCTCVPPHCTAHQHACPLGMPRTLTGPGSPSALPPCPPMRCCTALSPRFSGRKMSGKQKVEDICVGKRRDDGQEERSCREKGDSSELSRAREELSRIRMMQSCRVIAVMGTELPCNL